MNLADWIDGWASLTPDKTALVFGGEAISYARLAEQVNAAAHVLSTELGLGRGDRVGYLGLNRPECLHLLFACARIGAIYQPLNWRLAQPEHMEVLKDGAPRAVFVEPAWRQSMEAVRDRLPVTDWIALDEDAPGWRRFAPGGKGAPPAAGSWEDPVLLVHTSGTTGAPKGALLTQNALLFNALNSNHLHDLTSDDVILSDLPLFHVGGINNQTLPALHAGATVVLHDKFDPVRCLAAIAEHRPSLTCLVPAQLEALMALPEWERADLSCLRTILTGSTMVAHDLIARVHARGVPVTQMYGTTETAPVVVYLRIPDALDHVGSTGKPAVYTRMRIVDEAGRDLPAGGRGEIWIKAPNLMREYWKRPKETAEALTDGWFHTGDIGYTDANGYLFVVDRKKDMIISGGENIYPAELEQILAGAPGIAEAAVVGQAHSRWGEVPVAVVVADPPGSLSESDVLALFDGRLARYKHPKRVVFAEALPRNAMGKIQKGMVADLLSSKKDAP